MDISVTNHLDNLGFRIIIGKYYLTNLHNRGTPLPHVHTHHVHTHDRAECTASYRKLRDHCWSSGGSLLAQGCCNQHSAHVLHIKIVSMHYKNKCTRNKVYYKSKLCLRTV